MEKGEKTTREEMILPVQMILPAETFLPLEIIQTVALVALTSSFGNSEFHFLVISLKCPCLNFANGMGRASTFDTLGQQPARVTLW
jgi:hypothetical protein